MDRETLTLVATIIAIVGVIFLFREMNKAKADVENLKNFSAHLIQRLSAPPPAAAASASPALEREPKPEPEHEPTKVVEKKEVE